MVCSPRWHDVNGQTKGRTIITNIHRRFKFELVRSGIRLAHKMWTTYLLLSPMPSPPVNHGALRCIANPLENRCFSCVCPSEDKHSELDIRNSLSGLYGRHQCDGVGKASVVDRCVDRLARSGRPRARAPIVKSHLHTVLPLGGSYYKNSHQSFRFCLFMTLAAHKHERLICHGLVL
jgi:hypothetical protein